MQGEDLKGPVFDLAAGKKLLDDLEAAEDKQTFMSTLTRAHFDNLFVNNSSDTEMEFKRLAELGCLWWKYMRESKSGANEYYSSGSEAEFDVAAGEQLLNDLIAAEDANAFLSSLSEEQMTNLCVGFSEREDDFPRRSELIRLWRNHAWKE